MSKLNHLTFTISEVFETNQLLYGKDIYKNLKSALLISKRILSEVLQMIKILSRLGHHHNGDRRVKRLKHCKQNFHHIQTNQKMIFERSLLAMSYEFT
jgi:hypothetical protein